MLHERIYLDPDDENVYIDAYVLEDKSRPHDAMLVIPGGGYRGVCHDREGEPIAIAYLAKGYNAFVLNYRVGGPKYPAQLIDASRAILHIRANAEKYSIDKNRVFAVGFSAGGHLAGSLAIMHNDREVLSSLGISEGENRPDGVVLAYPVVTAMTKTHLGSFVNLSGGVPFDEIPIEEKKRYSLELHVDSSSAPAFIWHTAEDQVVPMCGSLRLTEAYVDAGVTVSLKVYPYGPHGLALSNLITLRNSYDTVQPLAEGWLDDSVEFLNTIKK